MKGDQGWGRKNTLNIQHDLAQAANTNIHLSVCIRRLGDRLPWGVCSGRGQLLGRELVGVEPHCFDLFRKEIDTGVGVGGRIFPTPQSKAL